MSSQSFFPANPAQTSTPIAHFREVLNSFWDAIGNAKQPSCHATELIYCRHEALTSIVHLGRDLGQMKSRLAPNDKANYDRLMGQAESLLDLYSDEYFETKGLVRSEMTMHEIGESWILSKKWDEHKALQMRKAPRHLSIV